MASSIKLLINCVKFEYGTDLPKNKQSLKECYAQIRVKDTQHTTQLSKPGQTATFNELCEFDLTGWWYKYQVTLAFNEKRKLRKDALLGGLSLTVNELLDAVGFDTGLHADNDNSRVGFQQNSVLGVRPGANPTQIFWCPIRKPPAKQGQEGDVCGRCAIRIDYINKSDIPSTWNNMSTEQKFQLAADARRHEQEQIEENNKRYQQAGSKGGGMFNFGSGSNRLANASSTALNNLPSTESVGNMFSALGGMLVGLFTALRDNIPAINQYSNNKSAISYSIWWLTLGILIFVTGTSYRLDYGFMTGMLISVFSGLLLVVWAIVLGTNNQVRNYDLPTALGMGLISGYLYDIVNGNIIIRLISIVLLGIAAGWSCWYTTVTQGTTYHTQQLYNNGEPGFNAIKRTVGNHVKIASKATINNNNIHSTEHPIVRCTLFVVGVIITQWCDMIVHGLEALTDTEVLTEVLAFSIPLAIYGVVYTIRNKVGPIAIVLGLLNSIVFIFGLFLFLPYLTHIIAHIAKQVVQYDCIHLSMIPIASITASMLEQSRSKQQQQQSTSQNNSVSNDDYITPGGYDDTDNSNSSKYNSSASGSGYRLNNVYNNSDTDYSNQYMNQVRQRDNAAGQPISVY